MTGARTFPLIDRMPLGGDFRSYVVAALGLGYHRVFLGSRSFARKGFRPWVSCFKRSDVFCTAGRDTM
jgi:hypothetical protein